jgi:hypothetical protein
MPFEELELSVCRRSRLLVTDKRVERAVVGYSKLGGHPSPPRGQSIERSSESFLASAQTSPAAR